MVCFYVFFRFSLCMALLSGSIGLILSILLPVPVKYRADCQPVISSTDSAGYHIVSDFSKTGPVACCNPSSSCVCSFIRIATRGSSRQSLFFLLLQDRTGWWPDRVTGFPEWLFTTHTWIIGTRPGQPIFPPQSSMKYISYRQNSPGRGGEDAVTIGVVISYIHAILVYRLCSSLFDGMPYNTVRYFQ